MVVLVATGGSSGTSALDQHILRAAAIALPKPAPNTIVHISATQTMTPNARHHDALLVPILNAEGWFQQGGPTAVGDPGAGPWPHPDLADGLASLRPPRPAACTSIRRSPAATPTSR